MGIKPHHGPAMRANVVADIFGSQQSLQFGEAIICSATRNLERLRRSHGDRVRHRQLLTRFGCGIGQFAAMDDQGRRKQRRPLCRVHQHRWSELDVACGCECEHNFGKPMQLCGSE